MLSVTLIQGFLKMLNVCFQPPVSIFVVGLFRARLQENVEETLSSHEFY